MPQSWSLRPYTKEFGGFGPFVKVQNLRILHELSKVSKRLTVINIRSLNLTCRSYAIKIVDTVRVWTVFKEESVVKLVEIDRYKFKVETRSKVGSLSWD